MANIAQLLTEHIDIWTAAESEKKSGRGRASSNSSGIYGVKKLRELILELAIRGKLVPQDPNDEPASELLKRIQSEKTKSKITISEKEKPFSLPQGWEWVYFGEIAQHNSGKTLDKGRNKGTLRDYITTSNLYWGAFELDSVKQMPIEENELERCTAQKGDLLICEGGEAGRAAVWTFDKEVCFQNHVHRARMYENISPFYAYRYFERLNATGEIEQYRKGVGISNMSGKALASVVFALPPLAEQHRIVAKVDELMAVCDQLEQQHGKSQEAHETLVSQVLTSLTQSQNAAEFNANWQRIYANFDVLFTTETSIDFLKQTLLQLAVMGKLVPQDPNDEPASELLKRIQAEKAKLIAEGKLKKEKPLAQISVDEKPFELPKGWEWVRLASTGITSTGGTPKTSDTHMFGGNIPFIGPGQISPAGELLEAEKYLTEVGIAQSTLAESGDILMVCIGGSIGKTLLVNERLTFNQQINCVKPVLVNSSYLICMMNSTIFQQELLLNATGSATPIINRSKWDELLVALAPLEEQHRIVAKIDVLMALCDQLKTRIQQANQQQQVIADALVAQAVA